MKLIPILESILHENSLKQIDLTTAIALSQKGDVVAVGEWLNKGLEDIKFYFGKEDISLFEPQIKEMVGTYDEYPQDEARTKQIYSLLKSGKKEMPIFVTLNDNDRFILEGRHRIVAFYWVGLNVVPVIYVK